MICFFKTQQMSLTDAYLAFNLGAAPDAEKPTFPDWLSRLAYQLVNNKFDEVSMHSPVSTRGSISSTAHPPPVLQSHEQHALHNLCLLSPYNSAEANPRRQCSVPKCKRKTELYCLDCSKIDHASGNRLFFSCGAGQRVTKFKEGDPKITQPLCYKWHLDHWNDQPPGSGEASDSSD
jgi:hypothetical protein